MKIAVFGSEGQLGQALVRVLSDHEVVAFSHQAVDIGDREAVLSACSAAKPSVLINAAAMTNVDACESDPQAAYRNNALGARWLGEASSRLGALLVQISTDYVFPGRAEGLYNEWDEPCALQEYGRSKLAGERDVQSIASRHLIVRTSWLYGGSGNGFVRSILAKARMGTALQVVTDQVGSPSFTSDVAAGVRRLIDQGALGVVHLTNKGRVSRLAFAEEIVHLAGLNVLITPIVSTQVTTPAKRPTDTSLASLVCSSIGNEMRGWKDALSVYIQEEGQHDN